MAPPEQTNLESESQKVLETNPEIKLIDGAPDEIKFWCSNTINKQINKNWFQIEDEVKSKLNPSVFFLIF